MRIFSKNKTIQEESIDVYCILEFQKVISTKTDVYAFMFIVLFKRNNLKIITFFLALSMKMHWKLEQDQYVVL